MLWSKSLQQVGAPTQTAVWIRPHYKAVLDVHYKALPTGFMYGDCANVWGCRTSAWVQSHWNTFVRLAAFWMVDLFFWKCFAYFLLFRCPEPCTQSALRKVWLAGAHQRVVWMRQLCPACLVSLQCKSWSSHCFLKGVAFVCSILRSLHIWTM